MRASGPTRGGALTPQRPRAGWRGAAEAQGNRIAGGPGPDILRGTATADLMSGGRGDDRLPGLGGNDRLRGAADSDVLDGGAGDDRLDGGLGDDMLFGGTDADRFVIDRSDGLDRIMDFAHDESDLIDLSAFAAAAPPLRVTQRGSWVHLAVADGTGFDLVAMVRNAHAGDVHAAIDWGDLLA